jgi:hypothetical protein
MTAGIASTFDLVLFDEFFNSIDANSRFVYVRLDHTSFLEEISPIRESSTSSSRSIRPLKSGIYNVIASAMIQGKIALLSSSTSPSVTVLNSLSNVSFPKQAQFRLRGFIQPMSSGSTTISVNTGQRTNVVMWFNDLRASKFVGHGHAVLQIGSKVEHVSFVVSDRKPRQSPVSVTIQFVAATSLAQNASITVSYPSGFLDTSVKPNVVIADGTAEASFPGQTSITITLNASAFVSGGSVYTLTLTGCKLGGPHAGSSTGVTVQTSEDFASAGVSSGSIGGKVTMASFVIAPSDRVASRVNVPVTVSFVAATSLVSNSIITVSYPSGFLDTSFRPSVSVPQHLSATSAFPGQTSLAITLDSVGGGWQGLNFVLTLTGCKLG